MIQDSMTLGQAGIVSLASMTVVFCVLLVLFVAVTIFGKVASSRKAKAQPAAAPKAAVTSAAAPAVPAQDDRDLFCVLAAAVAAYEEGSGNPMVRNRGDLD